MKRSSVPFLNRLRSIVREMPSAQDEYVVAEAARRLRREYENDGYVFDPSREALLEEACHILREEIESRIAWIPALRVIAGNSERRSWYPPEDMDSIHWPALQGYLQNHRSWDDLRLERLHRESDEVVSRLGNPKEQHFQVRGLVVGHVQSGKTANMTAVIAKAVDAGYTMVIVLAGMTDLLRQQTQRRLVHDLVDRCRGNWHLVTHEEEDYARERSRCLPPLTADVVTLAVLKKNPAPLSKLLADIRDTPTARIRRIRALVIDDEADQASVNVARNPEEMSAINASIRKIVGAFDAVSYIGYTATPFANVLIDPYAGSRTRGGLDDLYPKDFIVALGRPQEYFGPERLFGREPIDPDDPGDDGLDVVRFIPEHELKDLMESGVAPPTLTQAIRYLFLAAACRRARGFEDEHTTMLLHTSRLTDEHEQLRSIVESILVECSERVRDQVFIAELRAQWNDEMKRVPESLADGTRAFDDLLSHGILERVIRETTIVVENSASEKRLGQTVGQAPFIVIGGNILSRGLTLEGLVVSYFARQSQQYDTLLQMGRWFGYRPGYEDLPRIWTTEPLYERFRMLSAVEKEIREEIDNYAQQGATPMDIAVRIPLLPGLAVTARAKMRHARKVSMSYAGRHVQTIWFARTDEKTLRNNWVAAENLVESIGRFRRPGSQKPMFQAVPKDAVLAFLKRYRIHDAHRDLDSDWLRRYISDSGHAGKLDKWNVAIVFPNDGPEARLGPFRVRLNRRARLPRANQAVAYIKALMSRRDILIDCSLQYERSVSGRLGWADLKQLRRESLAEDCPLLLIYPIDAKSPPKSGERRVALDAVHNVLGIGMVFPGGLAGRDADIVRIQVNLKQHDWAVEDDREKPDV